MDPLTSGQTAGHEGHPRGSGVARRRHTRVAFGRSDNQDGIWTFLVDGRQVWSYDLGSFVTGLLWDSGERVSPLDSARSDFDTVRRMGADAQWHPPTSAYEGGPAYSFDPDFKPCIYNDGAHTTVVRNETAC